MNRTLHGVLIGLVVIFWGMCQISPSDAKTTYVQVFVVFFDGDSAEVDAGGQGAIQQATDAWWHTRGKGGVAVSGYTDLSLSPGESQQLSEQRAKNVAAVLARLGVPEDRLFIEGRGGNDPRVPTGLGVSEPQNQRVELVILSAKEARQAQRQATEPHAGTDNQSSSSPTTTPSGEEPHAGTDNPATTATTPSGEEPGTASGRATPPQTEENASNLAPVAHDPGGMGMISSDPSKSTWHPSSVPTPRNPVLDTPAYKECADYIKLQIDGYRQGRIYGEDSITAEYMNEDFNRYLDTILIKNQIECEKNPTQRINIHIKMDNGSNDWFKLKSIGNDQ